MGKLAKCLLTVALLPCLAFPALAANKYPPGPGGTCIDTLKISDIENPAATCHPAVLDTVLGVGGIIIGFDAKPSAFATYFQSRGNASFAGIQAFTGATNYNASPFSLALGDSIIVYGTVQEFPNPNGTTEIEGPDGTQSSNDIVIRKVSSGNSLPPFTILTTHQINWIPSSPGNLGETYEQCLVKVNGPLKVGRASTQGGNPLLPFNSFLVVSASSPGDSVLIDGNLLTTFTPPAQGTSVGFVQGIVIQNTTSGTNSYRITIRDNNDVSLVAAPNLTDGFPYSDTITQPLSAAGRPHGLASNEVLRLVFDQNVDVATAQNIANYSLASGIDGSTVDAAVVVNPTTVHLSITSVRGRGDLETVTGSGIGSLTCPACLMSSQSRTFYNAVLTVAEVQAAAPESLSGATNGCQDRSRFAGTGSTVGTRLSLHGVGVGKFGSLQYLEDAGAPQRGGVSVFGPSAPLDLGHKYLIAGQVQEFGSETEVANNVYLEDQGTVATPGAIIFTDKQVSTVKDSTCDAAGNITNGEDYEGMLIRINRLHVAEQRTAGQSFLAANISGSAPDDTILVSNLNNTLGSYTPPNLGDIVDVTGILHFASGTFRICPRTTADISNPTAGVDGSGKGVQFSAYPNPARTTNITFYLPHRENVDLAIYDVAGRRVTVLAHGAMPAGSFTKQWAGRDDSGNTVGAGVYFLHLRVGQEIYKLTTVKLN